MIANYHTHTKFCDGENTPEEIVASALERGLSAIGFSGHGYTSFDTGYCMKETEEYIAEINRLKEKYKKEIQIYLGIEEDAFHYTDRAKFDYIIGSSHYFNIDGSYYPIDSSNDHFKRALELFSGDTLRMADAYYGAFCDYIIKRKPDIVGHFDLITKYDEINGSLLLSDAEYNGIAEKYIGLASRAGCIFEVNTGAIARGVRTSPYPAENLLHVLKRNGTGIILSSDSHSGKTLDFGFDEVKSYLKDIGFKYTYVLYDNRFIKDFL